MTDLIEIDFPTEHVQTCADWHSGLSCMLYAVASTGNVSLGTIRPRKEDGTRMSDREWQVHLWDCLSCDAWAALRNLDENSPERDRLEALESFADETAEKLRTAYNLQE